jgi:hypothetical protein
MMVVLRKPIADYFNADKDSSTAVVNCFTPTGMVKDKGLTYNGSAEIKKWNAAATAKYHYTCDPIAAEESEGIHLVMCHLEGDFPESPVNRLYRFTLEGSKIAALNIG